MADQTENSHCKGMPLLLEKIRERVFPRERSIRIVVLGSSGVGKTVLQLSFSTADYICSVGISEQFNSSKNISGHNIGGVLEKRTEIDLRLEALIIRCLTNQFFNNYVPGKETAYRHSITVGPKRILLDIMDSNGKNNALISYTDAVILVYSITDKNSFENIKSLIERVRGLNLNNVPIVVIANKIDQNKKREVNKAESEELSRDYGVKVFERSAAIPTDNISSVFIELYKLFAENKKVRRSSDPSALDPSTKMTLRSIKRRLSTSLDPNDFIKLAIS